jgi:hypothetical protein
MHVALISTVLKDDWEILTLASFEVGKVRVRLSGPDNRLAVSPMGNGQKPHAPSSCKLEALFDRRLVRYRNNFILVRPHDLEFHLHLTEKPASEFASAENPWLDQACRHCMGSGIRRSAAVFTNSRTASDLWLVAIGIGRLKNFHVFPHPHRCSRIVSLSCHLRNGATG